MSSIGPIRIELASRAQDRPSERLLSGSRRTRFKTCFEWCPQPYKGWERTGEQLATFLTNAGFTKPTVIDTVGPMRIVEATAS
jgi:hypothetical protein